MNFIQPSIDPVILSIGFIEIRWYSLAYILGFLLGIYIIKRLNAIYGNQYSNKNIDSFLIWAVLGVIIGGRTGYVIFYQLNEFLTNPFYLFEIWNGGMSFHGGLTGIIISTLIFAKINRKSFFYLSDLVSIVAPIGLFLGRQKITYFMGMGVLLATFGAGWISGPPQLNFNLPEWLTVIGAFMFAAHIIATDRVTQDRNTVHLTVVMLCTIAIISMLIFPFFVVKSFVTYFFSNPE